MFSGVTLVISPLISLMKNQVMSLVQNGVAAAYINSSLTPLQYDKVLMNAAKTLTPSVTVVSRHLNCFAEQGTWISLYIFSIGAVIRILNRSFIGALLLVVLFPGSPAFAEEINKSKYPEYARYCKTVSKFFPWKRYN